MLTFVSGWRSPDRDNVIVAHRDPNRPAVFFIDDSSRLPAQLPGAPVIDLYRNGRADFELDDHCSTQIVRINYDTENTLIAPSVGRALQHANDAQIIVMYEATDKLFRYYPALRQTDALLAADPRLNADEGDYVIFTRGGSFSWKDHLIESQTAALVGDEELNIGVVSEALTEIDF